MRHPVLACSQTALQMARPATGGPLVGGVGADDKPSLRGVVRRVTTSTTLQIKVEPDTLQGLRR